VCAPQKANTVDRKALLRGLNEAQHDGDMSMLDASILEHQITEHQNKPNRATIKGLKATLLAIYNSLATADT